MSNESTPSPQPQLQDAPPAKPGQEAVAASDSGKPWILGMAAALMLIVGLVIGSSVWSGPKMDKHVAPFLEIVSSGEYSRAYHKVAQEWRAVTPEAEFVAIHQNLHQTMGKFQSLKQLEIEEMEHDQLGKLASVVFRGDFEKGEVRITSLLRQQGEDWQILGMVYDSPELEQAAAAAVARNRAEREGQRSSAAGPQPPANMTSATTLPAPEATMEPAGTR